MEVVIEEGFGLGGRAVARGNCQQRSDGVRAEERLNLDRGQFSIVESGVVDFHAVCNGGVEPSS